MNGKRNKKSDKFRKLKTIVIVMMLGATLTEADAQRTSLQQRAEKADSMLTLRYYKTAYDTNYVVRPAGKLTLKFRVNQSGNNYHMEGTVNGKDTKSDLKTDNKTTVSIGASYRGLSLSLSVNPAKLSGAYKDYEFNCNYYSSRFSFDLSYLRSESMAGDIEYGDEVVNITSGDISMKMLYMTGYYVFNHRRFSLPAALSQSYVQRHSSGTWLAGFSYQGGSIKTTEALQERIDIPYIRTYIGHFGIGGGYGYNLVLGRKWMFHLSILPTLMIYTNNNITINDEREYARHIQFSVMFNERAAIVYNFSPRYFAAATFTMNYSVFGNDDVVENQSKWRARATFGVRL